MVAAIFALSAALAACGDDNGGAGANGPGNGVTEAEEGAQEGAEGVEEGAEEGAEGIEEGVEELDE